MNEFGKGSAQESQAQKNRLSAGLFVFQWLVRTAGSLYMVPEGDSNFGLQAPY